MDIWTAAWKKSATLTAQYGMGVNEAPSPAF
jgi:hypothetical protein